MSVRLHFLFSMLAAALIPQLGGAQELPAETRQKIGEFLDATARKEISIGRITIDSVAIESNTLQLFANMNCSYIPFREANVAESALCYRANLQNTSYSYVPINTVLKN